MGKSAEDVTPAATIERPMRRDAARNRVALIKAARIVFAERGLDVSLDAIALRAGVGVGTAYRHFANKYELAAAVVSRAIDDVVELAHKCAANVDPWDGLVHFLESVCEAQTADRGLRDLLMGMHDQVLADEAHDRITAPLRLIVERAHASGALRKDASTTDIELVIVALCSIADVTGEVSADLWRRYLPMFLGGLMSGDPLPVPALSSQQLRSSLSTYTARYARTHRPSELPANELRA